MLSDELITSVSNNTVKRIRSLRQRRGRMEQSAFWVEGIRIVAEAIQTGAELECLVVAPELLHSEFANGLIAANRDVRRINVSAQVFASLSGKEGPQGLAAVIRQRWENLEALQLQPADLWVALDAPQDPGNLGTIMRTADAVGAAGLILVGHSADPYDPSAVRASMGSLFALRLIQTDLDSFLAWRQSNSVNLVGTAGGAALHYRQASYQRPLILLSGSERQGLPLQLQDACDQLVRIPMVGRCDSLNLAVATSVVLYQAFAEIEAQS